MCDELLPTRRIGQTIVDGLRVSTVRLPIDHSFGLGGPPLWYETMVFDDRTEEEKVATPTEKKEFYDSWHGWCERYETADAAGIRHGEIVAQIRRGEC